eukprot:2773193-Pyramimonas_sp.AAC.2
MEARRPEESGQPPRDQLVRRENIPARPASDWLVVRICSRARLRPIGLCLREYPRRASSSNKSSDNSPHSSNWP